MRRETLSVTGMSCSGCEQAVESAVGSVAGVTRIEADHEDDAVDVVADDDVSVSDLRMAVEQAGYDAA